jgi:nickel/cobalt transporter (NicO) family protein
LKSSVLLSICSTGFAVSFVHSILPTHWLPFVLAARAQKWSAGKTLGITALASGGHTLFTILLGIVVLGLGVTVEKWTGNVFPWIAGFALASFGAYYLLRPAGGHQHSHGHAHGHSHGAGEAAHEHPHVLSMYRPPARKPPVSDRAAILGLLAMLTFSPCEAFLPVYLSGVSYGWTGFAVLSAVLLLGCLAGMLAFTTLGLVGLQRFRMEALEEYEDRIVGGLLMLLAVLVIALEG